MIYAGPLGRHSHLLIEYFEVWLVIEYHIYIHVYHDQIMIDLFINTSHTFEYFCRPFKGFQKLKRATILLPGCSR